MLGLCLAPRRRPTELQPLGQAAGSTVAAVEMESKQISANEADEILQKWVTQSQRVCFAVCVGGIAWHSHWVGTLRSASMGRWVLTAGAPPRQPFTHQSRDKKSPGNLQPMGA